MRTLTRRLYGGCQYHLYLSLSLSLTRANFIHPFDYINIIHIDANSIVRAHSIPMQNAFRNIVSDPGFKEHLKKTLDRLDKSESLARTSEFGQRAAPERSRGEVAVVEYCAKI
jgi:hypothetical protein